MTPSRVSDVTYTHLRKEVDFLNLINDLENFSVASRIIGLVAWGCTSNAYDPARARRDDVAACDSCAWCVPFSVTNGRMTV